MQCPTPSGLVQSGDCLHVWLAQLPRAGRENPDVFVHGPVPQLPIQITERERQACLALEGMEGIPQDVLEERQRAEHSYVNFNSRCCRWKLCCEDAKSDG